MTQLNLMTRSSRKPSEKANHLVTDERGADAEHDQPAYNRRNDPAICATCLLRSTEVIFEQIDVFHVRAPTHIEHVPEYRNATDDGIDADVDDHSRERGCGRAQSRRRENDVAGERGTGDVADYRDEAEN